MNYSRLITFLILLIVLLFGCSGTVQVNQGDDIVQYTLTVQSTPESGGMVRINTEAWVFTMTLNIDTDSQITVEALANAGYKFEGWYIADQLVSENTVHEFIMVGDITIHAHFALQEVPTSKRIMPEDFEYLGAFLAPALEPAKPDSNSWEWGGMAMAYDALGDPGGPTDGYPGSLYGAGHDRWNLISEITIPVPIISETKTLEELNIARSLQPFYDVKGGLFPWIDEMPRVGIEVLGPQADQTTSKLHLCWGQHFQELHPSHMWCEKDLNNPQTKGAWVVEGLNPYNSSDYLFEIPQEWAQQYTPGLRLATGRYRDGGWSGFGPTLAVIGPWNEGNPPADGSTIASTILIKYSDHYEGEPDPWYEMDGYTHSDEWAGGAWLTAGDKSAVVFVGTKGIGETWYGDPNGPCMECGLPHLRGWWSDSFEGWFLLYDSADLALVAMGEMLPYEIQPYAHLNIDDVLYYIDVDQEKYHLGACSFDRNNGLFYVFEPGRESTAGKRYEQERTLVHVWRINRE